MQNLRDKIKKFFSPKGKNGSFFKRNFRIIAASILLVVLVAVLVYSVAVDSGRLRKMGKIEAGKANIENFEFDKEFIKDKKLNKKIKNLMNKYFEGYATADIDEMKEVATPVSGDEGNYIKFITSDYESFDNIKVYVKNGLTEGSYFVSVYYGLKFKNVDATVPGLEFFYLETDNKGKLYINNLYSSYNFSKNENAMDKTIYDLISKYEKQDDVAALRKDTETAYNKALAKDKDLAIAVTKIKDKIKEWSKKTEAAEEKAAKERAEKEKAKKEKAAKEKAEKEKAKKEKADKEKDKKKTEEKKSSEKKDDKSTEKKTENKQSDTVKVKGTGILVRDRAGTEGSQLVGSVDAGEYKKLGQEGDYILIQFTDDRGAHTGYINKQFVEN
ncbi:hypothetical protein [Lachnobacterium bovis]|uniref:SH3b domain-containing protein n=1 Tax=Lachnobacterium bovis TaxID=140626 RepID=A0A1H9PUJ3_9FIRM|nr:hypothetical protein [Lachnobacterium bovis]SER51459.1 hypothetical protein SAMN02910429_00297 [Lachnobacterium bovis]